MSYVNIIFFVYGPVYIYTLLALYLLFLVGSTITNKQASTFFTFQYINRHVSYSILFLLTLLTLLGTPPTLGFFAKILTFIVFLQNPGYELILTIIFVLILMIFYLQTVRTRPVLRKRILLKTQNITDL